MVYMWSYFDLVAPACLACGLRTAGMERLCSGCRGDLPAVPPGCPRCAQPSPTPGMPCEPCRATPLLTRTLAATCYAFPVDALVRQLKFEGRLPVADALGHHLLAHVRRAHAPGPLPQAVVPVPLHPARHRERGYNQAERIARPVSRGLGLPLRSDALIRQRATAAQSRMDLVERQQNLADAFRVVAPLPPHVAIVDDVVTSGSTLRAVAAALAATGVSRIDAWVVARTL